MEVIDDRNFLTKLCGEKKPEDCGITSLEEINNTLENLIPPFSKRGTEIDEFCVLSVDSITDFEGIVKIISLNIIPPGKKILTRARRHIVIADVLPRVVVPIILRVENESYILLAGQNRVTLGGKYTIEVYRGSVPHNTDENNYGKTLVNRKLNLIDDLFDLIEVRNLGTYWNNSGNSGTSSPIQALFYVSKKNITLSDLKKQLKVNYKYDADPISGPPLPLNSPILKKLSEVLERLSDVTDLTTNNEAYINDLFSITALAALKESLIKKPLPF
ncbi:hypothetical protein GYA27_03740 [candidate division WWE3 bacterium]|uniref:ParB/Sulfiredoxin domain-containing protein n=1 Tax=candidate division WWE3 bacterium TaxID=2053526 RepID=A0A7X9DL97_UNCKA|nr:hypothetical protein [candidate division WWE3 bacterium]